MSLEKVDLDLAGTNYVDFYNKWKDRDFADIPEEAEIIKELKAACKLLENNENLIIGCFDFRTFAIPFVTENIKDLIGYPVSHFHTHGMEATLNMMHPVDRELSYEFQEKLIETYDTLTLEEKKTFEYSYTLRWRHAETGEYIWFLDKVRPYILDEKGNIVYDLNFVSKMPAPPSPAHYQWEFSYIDQTGKKVVVTSVAKDFPDVKLSNRELEIANLLIKGKTSTEVADDLMLSLNTVQTHRKNIMQKIGGKNVADLIKFAVDKGLI